MVSLISDDSDTGCFWLLSENVGAWCSATSVSRLSARTIAPVHTLFATR